MCQYSALYCLFFKEFLKEIVILTKAFPHLPTVPWKFLGLLPFLVLFIFVVVFFRHMYCKQILQIFVSSCYRYFLNFQKAYNVNSDQLWYDKEIVNVYKMSNVLFYTNKTSHTKINVIVEITPQLTSLCFSLHLRCNPIFWKQRWTSDCVCVSVSNKSHLQLRPNSGTYLGFFDC